MLIGSSPVVTGTFNVRNNILVMRYVWKTWFSEISSVVKGHKWTRPVGPRHCHLFENLLKNEDFLLVQTAHL